MVLFVLYVLLSDLLSVFFLRDTDGLRRRSAYTDNNLKPFVEIRRFWMYREQVGLSAFFMNIFGNVIGFIPLGFILPVISRRCRSGFLIVLSGFSLSLCVETIQLVTRVGCFDVDDLILNTAGAAAGYVLFAVCNYLRRRHYGEKDIDIHL